jgi:hypothetical protein
VTELVQFIDLAELVLSFGTNPEFDGLKWTDSEKYGHMTSTDLYGDGPDFKLREFDVSHAWSFWYYCVGFGHIHIAILTAY